VSLSERRRAERFNVEVPVIVRWTDGTGPREARTITQNLSSGGMYFFLPEGIPDNTTVQVEMTLPAQITLGASVKVQCQGRIQRCELKSGEPVGMATAIEKYEFLPRTNEAA
jgi:hypothetical protein